MSKIVQVIGTLESASGEFTRLSPFVAPVYKLLDKIMTITSWSYDNFSSLDWKYDSTAYMSHMLGVECKLCNGCNDNEDEEPCKFAECKTCNRCNCDFNDIFPLYIIQFDDNSDDRYVVHPCQHIVLKI